jgi:xanthine dehydrogenase accessory factor
LQMPRLVLIRGAGDLATGTAHRLWRAGFAVVMLELSQPLVVRRTVSFAAAVYERTMEVETVRAELCPSNDQVATLLKSRVIPVLIDPEGVAIEILKPAVLVDAIMAKKNTGTGINNAGLVIGLGPGFTAGKDVHAVVETKRGHNLGRVLYKGSAAEDTGEPAMVNGYGSERLLRAPEEGNFYPLKAIGELVKSGDQVAYVDNHPIIASIDGMIRGLLYPGLKVVKGLKVGDIDPRGSEVDFKTISDKARSIGGGVLEAIMHRYFYN